MSGVSRAPLDGRGDEHPAFLTTLARLFNEGVMGFLALVALATALGPIVFDVSPRVERVLTNVGWALVTAFAMEFVIQGTVAPDRRAWLRSPWRIVDAVTILGPIVALLPQVHDFARGSLVLRLLRVGRAAALGTRAGSVAVRRPRGSVQTLRPTTPIVTMLDAENASQPARSDWATFLSWTVAPSAAWFHASNLNRDHFRELAHCAGVSDQELAAVAQEDGHAKLREGARYATLVLRIPTVVDTGFPEVHRDRLLAFITDHGLVTAMTGTIDLQRQVDPSGLTALSHVPFPARIVCALLTSTLERNVAIAQRFDDEARRLEALEGGRTFLGETFRLRREISTATLDLWHLKGIIRALADGKSELSGVNLGDEDYLDDLADESDSLYETVERNREELQTLTDLHINFKSFEMSSFLRLLAVVSFLGLIPSVAGGLLGMNVAGNPWPVTLSQVSFGVLMGMATALYVFAVKGWLK